MKTTLYYIAFQILALIALGLWLYFRGSIHDETPMPFGQFKGKMMKDLPAAYLLWLRHYQLGGGDIQSYILKNLKKIKKRYHEEFI